MPHLPPITVFDLETTGLDPRRGHRIIEIAGVRIENGVIQRETAFCTLVNPERDIPMDARQINRISPEEVVCAPTIDVVLPQFLGFAAGSILMAHNASFDMGFLEAEKEFCWGYVELPECLCTMKLYQSLYPSEFRASLDTLTRKFAIMLPEMNGLQRHRALTDALLTAEAFARMIADGNIFSIDELRRKAAIRILVAK